MRIRLIRHATIVVSTGNLKILVDPMLDAKGLRNPIPCRNLMRNPITGLPVGEEELKAIIEELDAVIITHMHGDHFDESAKRILPRELTVFCQPEDETAIRELGFTEVYPVENSVTWKNITFKRTGGQHGKGCTAKKMAPVSGFVLETPDEPSLYIAGDTVWCNEVEEAIEMNKPSIIVVNAGSARFLTGAPITMDREDIHKVCQKAPSAQIIAVHMEAMNHCTLKRTELKEYLKKEKLYERVAVPDDGEEV